MLELHGQKTERGGEDGCKRRQEFTKSKGLSSEGSREELNRVDPEPELRINIGPKGGLKILPDQGVGAGHGGLGDEKGDGEHPVVLPGCCRGEAAGTGGYQQEEEKNGLPSDGVTLESDH